MFDDPQIRQLIKDDHIIGTISELEMNAWSPFKDFFKNFLGNKLAKNYTEIIEKLSHRVQHGHQIVFSTQASS